MGLIGRKDTPLDPSEGDVDDQLDIKPFSDGLYEFVRNCDTPMTIGLQGEWGSGKTSLMKLVRDRLRKEATEASVITFWFETWQYGAVGGSDALGMLLLRDLTDRLLESLKGDPSVYKFRDQLGAAMRAALPSLAGLATSVVTRNDRAADAVTAAAGSVLGGERSDIRAAFSELVDKALSASTDERRRLVVFIDDLDRVPPVLAVRLLTILKNFMDVAQCVFVVACDYDVVREGVNTLMGLGEGPHHAVTKEKVDAFFHKLFQVQFLMPVGAYKTDKILREYLTTRLREHNGVGELPVRRQNDWDKQLANFIASGTTKVHASKIRADGWFDRLIRLIESVVGTNPRALKRYLNLVDLTCCVDEAFGDEKLAHWTLGSSDDNVATLRWCTAVFPIVALQQRWPSVAATWLAGVDVGGRPTSGPCEVAYTDFERRLRTILDDWPGSDSDDDDDDAAARLEDVVFRQQLQDVFGCDIRDHNPPAAVHALTDFAEHWFKLLNNSAKADDVLDDEELKIIASWSRRLGKMGTSTVRLAGIARLRKECMEIDEQAGNDFVALASHLLHWVNEEGLFHVSGRPGRASVVFHVDVHQKRRTLMVFQHKGDKLRIKINATERSSERWDLPDLEDAGEELHNALLNTPGTAAAHLRKVPTAYILDFRKGHTPERNDQLRELFTKFLLRVDNLAHRSRPATAPPDTGHGDAEDRP